MAYDRFIHHRKSIRVKGFDYTQPGMYYVTIVAHRRLPIFGEIINGIMRLNKCGQIARVEWMKTTAIRHEIELDEFVVMPNHFHAIVTIVDGGNDLVRAHGRNEPTALNGIAGAHGRNEPTALNGIVGAHGRAPLRRSPRSLASLIAGYKSAVTERINQFRGTPGAPAWQRNYWEHIIRNNADLARIREYIRNNPAAWETDDEHHHQH